MSTPLPPTLGGPRARGRPIVDADEYARVNNALNRMLFLPSGRSSGLSPYRNLLPFYNSLLVGSILHVGHAALSMVPTACVFFGRDGRLNLAFNPYYIDLVQTVLVAWPQTSADQQRYATGAVDGEVWLVRPSFSVLPSFIRASYLRQRLEVFLRDRVRVEQPDAAAQFDIDEMRPDGLIRILVGDDEEEMNKIWAMGPVELGVPIDRPIAIRVDNRQFVALCVHEILHVAHLHLLIDQRKFDDARALGLAVDVAIDQFIDDVPDDQWRFHLELFARFGEPVLEANRSFDYYYARLKAFYAKYANKTTQTASGPVTLQCGPQSGTPGHRPPSNRPKPGQPVAGQPAGPPGKPQPGQAGGPPSQIPTVIVVPQTVDDHTPWKPPDDIDVLSHQGWLQQFRDKLAQNPTWGNLLGDLVRKIDEFLAPKIRWQPLLKRWVGDKIRVDRESTRKRPSRRLGWDAPGHKTVRSSRILVAVDNSGSVTVGEAAQFFGEIASFLSVIEVVVCIWDTGIHQMVLVKNRAQLMKLAEGIGGGGGTDVLPVFAAVKNPSLVTDPRSRALLSQVRAMVVLTDGDLAWPGPEWEVRPTLWGITRKDNVANVPFGMAIFVDVEKE